MKKQSLIEDIKNPEITILEEDRSKLPEGVLLRVKGQFGITEQDNLNRRTYENSLWRNVLGKKEIAEKMQTRSLLGEADHPKELETSLTRVSHAVSKLWLDESSNKLMGEADILDTPSGRILNTLFRYGAQVGVSSRGQGAVIESNGRRVVDPSSYEYITHDFVLDPSCQGSFPTPVFESLAAQDYAEYQKEGQYFHKLYESIGMNLETLVEKTTQEKAGLEPLTETKETPDPSRESFLEQRVEELATSLNSFIDQIKEKDSRISKNQITIDGMKETIATQRQKIHGFESRKNSIESRLEIVGSLQTKLEEADTIRSRAERKADVLTKELSESREKIRNLRESSSKAARESKKLKEQLQVCRVRLGKAEALVMESHKDSHLSEVDTEIMKRDISENFDRQLQDSKTENTVLQGKVQDARSREKELSQKITNLEIANLALRNGIAERKVFSGLESRGLVATVENAKLIVEMLRGQVKNSPILEGEASVEIKNDRPVQTTGTEVVKTRLSETLKRMKSGARDIPPEVVFK